MRLFEYEGVELLRRSGIATMPSGVARTIEEAAACAATLGYPVVVKAQVLAGGRGKAGGVKPVQDETALRASAASLFGMTIKGETCDTLLVAKAADIAHEFYAGVTLDAAAGAPVLIFCAEGGMDIETLAKTAPHKLRKLPLSTLRLPRRHEILDQIRLAGITGDTLPKITTTVQQLIAAFFAHDCATLEINPLAVLADGQPVALDAKAVIDDSALKRQGMAKTVAAPAVTLEQRAAAAGVNYVRLDGDVGVIASGAGLAMASMDTVTACGCRAASFLDTGGGISCANMAEALRITLATPGVRAVFLNIFAGINNCAEVAKGIATVIDEDKPAAPLIVRMRGHSQEEGWAILTSRNIPVAKGATEEAVRLLAARLKGL